MKDIFELATMGTADVTVLTPKVISATIEEIRRSKRVFAQFYKANRDLVNTGGTEISFPKKKAGVVVSTNLSPGQGISASNISYDATTIKIAKHGVGIAIQGEAIRQVKRDIIADNIKEAGEAYADAMDTLALEAMFPTVTVTPSGASTIAASFPVIGIKSVADTSKFTGIINYASSSSIIVTGPNTITYWYVPSTAGARRVTATEGSLSAKDIWQLRADIISQKFDPDVLIINQRRLAELFYDPAAKFLEAYAYRGAGPLLNGEIGQLFGLKVIVTDHCPIYGAIAIDSDELGYHVVRKGLELKRDEYTGASMDVLYWWGFAEENYGVVNEKAYGAVAIKGTLTEVNATR